MDQGRPAGPKPSVSYLMLIAGLAGALALWWYSSWNERELANRVFHQDFGEQVHAIDRHLSLTVATIDDLANALAIAGDISDEQFAQFVSPPLARNLELQAMGWNSIVTRDERQQHEQAARAAGWANYQIKEIGPDGEPVTAADRDRYVVVRFIQPMAGNEAALGLDVSSESKRLQAIQAAIQRRATVATAPITLVQETEAQAGSLLFSPQFDRDGNVVAFVVAVMRIPSMVSQALASVSKKTMGLKLEDITDENSATIFEHQLANPIDFRNAEARLEFAGRTWRMTAQAGEDYAPEQLVPGIIVALTCLAVILMFFYIRIQINHGRALNLEIDRRQQISDALVETEERYRLICEISSSGAWDWDLQTQQCYYSATLSASLGHRFQEGTLSSELMPKLIHSDDYQSIQEQLDGLRVDSPEMNVELRLRHRTGDYHYYRVVGRVVAFSADGKPARVLGATVDINAEKLAEESRLALQQKAQDDKKIESLSILAGGVAHDFNNLLVGILNAADLATEVKDENETRELLSIIKESSERAAELTRALRLYVGSDKVSYQTVDLAQIAAQMRPLLASSLSANVSLTVRSGTKAVHASCDPTQIRQVMMNLVTNSAEAIGHQTGHLSLSVEPWSPKDPEPGEKRYGEELKEQDYICITMVDDGEGMSNRTLQQAFDPFFSTKGASRGLGLAASLGIVRAHGGTIGVVSTPAAGTTIRVILPRGEVNVTEQQDSTPQPDTMPALDILLVDDDELVTNIVSRQLTNMGHRVTTAPGGEEALSLLAEHNDFDVVLLDGKMPALSGIETMARITKLSSTLPVILMSGILHDPDEGDTRQDGFAGFLQKPFTQKQLVAALAEVSGRHA